MHPIIKALSAIPGRKKITWTALPIDGGEPCESCHQSTYYAGEFFMEGRELKDTTWRHLLSPRGINISGCMVSFLVRQFTDRVEAETKVPVKVIYGFSALGDLVVRLPPDEVKFCHEHDSSTMEYIGREPGVEYA